MTSDEVAAETTIRTRCGNTVSVRRLVSVEGGALYASVNDDDRRIGYTFAKLEAMRFAGALLEAVGVPYFFEGRDPRPDLLGQDRAKRPEANVLDNGAPVVTALQILERIAFVIASKEEAENTERTRERLAILAELAHLAGVAMGRAQIVPPKD